MGAKMYKVIYHLSVPLNSHSQGLAYLKLLYPQVPSRLHFPPHSNLSPHALQGYWTYIRKCTKGSPVPCGDVYLSNHIDKVKIFMVFNTMVQLPYDIMV